MDDKALKQLPKKIRSALAAHRFALALMLVSVVTGMAYSLWWQSILFGIPHAGWLTPPDFWSTVRASHFVAWGDLGGIYGATGNIVTFPGLAILLAPVMLLGSSLHLSASYPFMLPRPTAWLLYGPVEIALGSSALIGLESLLLRFDAPKGKRRLALVVAGLALWPTYVMWGHPEDTIALGCGCLALCALIDKRYPATGWWFAAGICFQPLVGLMLPVALGVAGARRAIPMLIRSGLVPGFLIAVPLLSNFQTTFRSVVEQPTYPPLGTSHDTPLVHLATPLAPPVSKTLIAHHGQTKLPSGMKGSGSTRTLFHHYPGLKVLLQGSKITFHAGAAHLPAIVSGGTPRIGAIALAFILAWWASKHREQPGFVLWASAVALAARPIFEAVDFAYYLGVGTAMLVVTFFCARTSPSSRSRTRENASSLLVCAVAIGTIVLGYFHLGSWIWWLGVVLAIGTLSALAGWKWLHPVAQHSQVSDDAMASEATNRHPSTAAELAGVTW